MKDHFGSSEQTSAADICAFHRFDPFHLLARPEDAILVHEGDLTLSPDDDDDTPLYGFLFSDAHLEAEQGWAHRLKGLPDDDFAPGDRLIKTPQRNPDGSFAFSLLLALQKPVAGAILKESPVYDFTSVKSAFRNFMLEEELTPVGYATLTGQFTLVSEPQESCSGPSPMRPQECQRYRLSLKPEAVFVAEPFRGRKIGHMASAALARPVLDQMRYFFSLNRSLGRFDIIEIIARIEAETDRSKAVMRTFQSQLHYATLLFSNEEEGPDEAGTRIELLEGE